MIQINESEGNCKSCGKFDVLGDGLCQTCWDIKVDGGNPKNYYHKYTTEDYKQIWQLHTEKSLGSVRISKELNLPRVTLDRILQRLHSPKYQLLINKTDGLILQTIE